jgi:hypothetical protein
MRMALKSIGLLLLITLIPVARAYSGGVNYPAGSRQAGLAFSAITARSPWATFYNQASLARLEKFRFGVMAERKFGIQSLDAGAFSAAYPFEKLGTVAISFYQLSNGGAYTQQKYGLALSRAFGERLAIGMQFDAFSRSIQEFDQEWHFTGEVGFQFKLNERLTAGLHVFNPVGVNQEEDFTELTAPTGTVGLGYQFSDKAELHLATQQDLQHSTRFRAGIAYQPLESLEVQAGIATAPLNYSFGLGYQWKWLKINLSFGFHRNLGQTPYLSTNYQPQ